MMFTVNNRFKGINIFNLKKQFGGDITRRNGRLFFRKEISPGCFMCYHASHSGKVYTVTLNITTESFLLWAKTHYASELAFSSKLVTPAGEDIIPMEDHVFATMKLTFPEFGLDYVPTIALRTVTAQSVFGLDVNLNSEDYRIYSINIWGSRVKGVFKLDVFELITKGDETTPRTYRYNLAGLVYGLRAIKQVQ